MTNSDNGSKGGRHGDKVQASVLDAIESVQDGASIMVGGFGLCGNPEGLIDGVLDKGVRDLTIISNNAGNLGKGLAKWLKAGVVSKVICSYLGNNEDLHRMMAEGTLKVEVNPQGTLVERMRAAGMSFTTCPAVANEKSTVAVSLFPTLALFGGCGE